MTDSALTAQQPGQRLLWQCRRGMLELDILLQGFVENHYSNLTLEEKQTFAALLKYPDQELLEYFLQQSQPDDKDIAHLVQSIRDAVSR